MNKNEIRMTEFQNDRHRSLLGVLSDGSEIDNVKFRMTLVVNGIDEASMTVSRTLIEENSHLNVLEMMKAQLLHENADTVDGKRISKRDRAVYRMELDCGRMGSLIGIFSADKRHIDYLVSSGLEIYFGEVLGKHSEIFGPIEKDEIEMISDDPEKVRWFDDNDLATGFNPLNLYCTGVPDIEQGLTAMAIIDGRMEG